LVSPSTKGCWLAIAAAAREAGEVTNTDQNHAGIDAKLAITCGWKSRPFGELFGHPTPNRNPGGTNLEDKGMKVRDWKTMKLPMAFQRLVRPSPASDSHEL
jgi:hypothetical protein